MNIVYILFSEKLNKYYIGYSSNLEKRLIFHNTDKQTRKFTYNADDWVLIFQIVCESKEQALLIEKHIKKMKSKIYIENLLKYDEMKLKLLQKFSNNIDC